MDGGHGHGHGHGHGGHGHGHGHGGGGHQCSHEVAADELDRGVSLYPEIALDQVRGLNEEEEGSVRRCIKPYEQAQDESEVARSDPDDHELIVFVPFRSQVKIKTVCVVGGRDGTAPTKVKIWANRDDIDFSNASDVPPTQELELAADAEPHEPIHYPVKPHKFGNVSSVCLFFHETAGADQTVLSFLGFRGESLGHKRVRAVNVVYEAQANPKDHEVKDEGFGAASNNVH